jgi:DnaJ-class molecular chaperone
MYQKCPVCNGSKKEPSNLPDTIRICTVCNGMGIISTLTGKPPTDNNTDFRDRPMESQQEYFGR